MKERISDPDAVMKRLEQVEAESSKFSELLKQLAEIVNRFKGFEDGYERIKSGFEGIQQSFSGLSEANEAARNRCASEAQNVAELRQALQAWQRDFDKSQEHQKAHLTDLQEKVSHAVAVVPQTLDSFEHSANDRLKSALQTMEKDLEQWKQGFTNQAESQANELGDLRAKVIAAVKLLNQKLDEFRQSADHKLEVGFESVRSDLEALQKKFEQEQFRKLDDAVQAYNLMRMRVENYEGRVEKAEESCKALADGFKQLENSFRNEVAAVKEAVESIKEEARGKLEALRRKQRRGFIIAISLIALFVFFGCWLMFGGDLVLRRLLGLL
jgi:chromosome segregation ATPase